MPDRKFQMMRLGPGDYLLPSNDMTSLWRIYKYEEDGSLSYRDDKGNDHVIRGTFWATAKRPLPREDETLDDVDAFLYSFEHWSGPHKTRQEAIDTVIR